MQTQQHSSTQRFITGSRLNGIDPERWLADVFARLVAGHPQNRLAELLPWNRRQAAPTALAA